MHRGDTSPLVHFYALLVRVETASDMDEAVGAILAARRRLDLEVANDFARSSVPKLQQGSTESSAFDKRLEGEENRLKVEAFGHLSFSAISGHSVLAFIPVIGLRQLPDYNPSSIDVIDPWYLHMNNIARIFDETEIDARFHLSFLTNQREEYKFVCSSASWYDDWIEILDEAFDECHPFDGLSKRYDLQGKQFSYVSENSVYSSLPIGDHGRALSGKPRQATESPKLSEVSTIFPSKSKDSRFSEGFTSVLKSEPVTILKTAKPSRVLSSISQSPQMIKPARIVNSDSSFAGFMRYIKQKSSFSRNSTANVAHFRRSQTVTGSLTREHNQKSDKPQKFEESYSSNTGYSLRSRANDAAEAATTVIPQKVSRKVGTLNLASIAAVQRSRFSSTVSAPIDSQFSNLRVRRKSGSINLHITTNNRSFIPEVLTSSSTNSIQTVNARLQPINSREPESTSRPNRKSNVPSLADLERYSKDLDDFYACLPRAGSNASSGNLARTLSENTRHHESVKVQIQDEFWDEFDRVTPPRLNEPSTSDYAFTATHPFVDKQVCNSPKYSLIQEDPQEISCKNSEVDTVCGSNNTLSANVSPWDSSVLSMGTIAADAADETHLVKSEKRDDIVNGTEQIRELQSSMHNNISSDEVIKKNVIVAEKCTPSEPSRSGHEPVKRRRSSKQMALLRKATEMILKDSGISTPANTAQARMTLEQILSSFDTEKNGRSEVKRRLRETSEAQSIRSELKLPTFVLNSAEKQEAPSNTGRLENIMKSNTNPAIDIEANSSQDFSDNLSDHDALADPRMENTSQPEAFEQWLPESRQGLEDCEEATAAFFLSNQTASESTTSVDTRNPPIPPLNVNSINESLDKAAEVVMPASGYIFARRTTSLSHLVAYLGNQPVETQGELVAKLLDEN
ncbi:hypothetical protein HDU83_002648 [Entophlyctis luteolus]|nr:hypothetical protein HDU83_002648 [Entophlyctis luteolus]